MSAEIQIIVCNYQTPHDLREFLHSVPQAVGHLDATLYVANVCPGESDTADVGMHPTHHHVIFEENVGYARAVNACSARERTPYLAIFNADVVLSPNFFVKAISALEEDESWGVLGPRQVDERNRLTAAGIFGTNDAPQHRAWLAADDVAYHDVRDDVVTLAGSALVAKRQCWDAMRDCPVFQEVFPHARGAFLPTQHYWNETGTMYHLRHHGWKCVYYGPLRVVHKWHRASPMGGWVDTAEVMDRDQAMFRGFCDRHGIGHD